MAEPGLGRFVETGQVGWALDGVGLGFRRPLRHAGDGVGIACLCRPALFEGGFQRAGALVELGRSLARLAIHAALVAQALLRQALGQLLVLGRLDLGKELVDGKCIGFPLLRARTFGIGGHGLRLDFGVGHCSAASMRRECGKA